MNRLLKEYLIAHPEKADEYQKASPAKKKQLEQEAIDFAENGPFPHTTYLMPFLDKNVVMLKNVITRPNIIVGDYTYYHDFDDATHFETKNVLHHHEFIGDKLIIGRFCQIAHGVTFIMDGANHQMDGFSTFPFAVVGQRKWKNAYTPRWPHKGDTVVGNDVWIGHKATIMPGITIGNGAVIATRSVVVKNVPPYTIVGGNPARSIRQRFDDATITELQNIAWWNWQIEKIITNIPAIVGADLEKLKN